MESTTTTQGLGRNKTATTGASTQTPSSEPYPRCTSESLRRTTSSTTLECTSRGTVSSRSRHLRLHQPTPRRRHVQCHFSTVPVVASVDGVPVMGCKMECEPRAARSRPALPPARSASDPPATTHIQKKMWR